MESEKKKETDKRKHAEKLERERHERVRLAALDRNGERSNTTKIVYGKNGVYHDDTGKLNTKIVTLKSTEKDGEVMFNAWVPASVSCNIIPRPGGNTKKTKATAGSNVIIPCVVMKRHVDVSWMHGKPLWFMCVKGYGTISDSEYISTLYLRDIKYGQVTLESPENAPFFILKHGDKKSSARLHMLQFCMSHGDYSRFRSYVRGLAWKIFNGDAKVDLTVLRLSVDFIDFVKHPKVAALFDLDKAEFIKQIKKRVKKGTK